MALTQCCLRWLTVAAHGDAWAADRSRCCGLAALLPSSSSAAACLARKQHCVSAIRQGDSGYRQGGWTDGLSRRRCGVELDGVCTGRLRCCGRSFRFEEEEAGLCTSRGPGHGPEDDEGGAFFLRRGKDTEARLGWRAWHDSLCSRIRRAHHLPAKSGWGLEKGAPDDGRAKRRGS